MRAALPAVEVAASGRVLSLERSGVGAGSADDFSYHGTYSWAPAEPIAPPAWLPRDDDASD